MGVSRMENNYENIYKKARENAGFTQEQLAALVTRPDDRPISVDTISNYERYKHQPDDVMVFKMARHCKSLRLIFEHLYMCTEYSKVLPPLDMNTDLRGAGFVHHCAIKDWEEKNKRVCDMLRDNEIDNLEMQDIDIVIKLLDELSGAALSLKISILEHLAKKDCYKF
jgi:transcriptional regulator with XRE-family HTH domain